MKQFILIIIACFAITIAYGQYSEEEKKALYPEKYTFEQAAEFEKNNEFDKAFWVYINLYPNNREKVVEKVKQFQQQNDTINLRSFIVNSFSNYAMFDPTIASWESGVPELNAERLALKGEWGDALIREFYKKDISENEVIPIRTKNGIMVIFNYEKAKYTLRVEGKDAKATERYLTFFVDNRVLQISIANVTDVPNLNKCKNKSDTLLAHMIYENEYLEKMTESALTMKKKKKFNVSGNEYLIWCFSLPKELKVELNNQYIMTTLVGDKIIMFNTAGDDSEKYKEVKKFFTKHASSLIIYDDSMDIDKIIEGVKNE